MKIITRSRLALAAYCAALLALVLFLRGNAVYNNALYQAGKWIGERLPQASLPWVVGFLRFGWIAVLIVAAWLVFRPQKK